MKADHDQQSQAVILFITDMLAPSLESSNGDGVEPIPD